MVKAPSNLRTFVDQLQAKGRYTFHKSEAIKALKVSEMAFLLAAARLIKKSRLVSPRRTFFVIVPTEYLSIGAPPADWFIHDLMSFHEQPYYVGLLSAAALHGAAHQQPQEFQVVTNKPLRPIETGRNRIRFFVNRHIETTATTKVNSPTGYLTISTPESTAIDLVRYLNAAGHLGNVATVLKELSEKIKPHLLSKAVRANAELSSVQRLGYILDFLRAKDLSHVLKEWCDQQSPVYIPLSPGDKKRNYPKNMKWHIIENEEVEVDI